MKNAFFKGHGLGNDYLVLDPKELGFRITPASVRRLCERHTGVGADGVLAPEPSRRADFGLRIWNPDGSEAEKSGNGLRIFARWLHATRRTRRTRFSVETRGGIVPVHLELDDAGDATRASLEMGRASFRPEDLPCSLEVEELVDVPIRAGHRSLRFTGVSVGNPHCVVFRPREKGFSRSDLLAVGPVLETHAIFPRFTNVQLVTDAGPHRLDVLVWERGAGETLASGSSACAAACAAVRRGVVESPVEVSMPGGVLHVEVDADYGVVLTGPVEEVCRGRLGDSWVRGLGAGESRRTSRR